SDVISIALLNALLIAIKFGCLLISKETISRLNRNKMEFRKEVPTCRVYECMGERNESKL
ncbi:hypothetical protein, partial [Lactococcus cremoris]|uniref:hypothetical protein n=1 Tax=Lactococcus lactis subsp. cremoris TaxID=1359 RepID=UPI001E4ECC78